jgi:hypothetical protein
MAAVAEKSEQSPSRAHRTSQMRSTRSRVRKNPIYVISRTTRLLVVFGVPALILTLSTGTAVGAHASSHDQGAKKLFSVARRLSFGNYGPEASIATTDSQSIFLTGTFEFANGAPAATLVRVKRSTLRVVARARLPSVTSVAYGDNALWWATGAPLGNAGTSLTPGHGRLLLKVNPTNLKVVARFRIPGTTELVAVARSSVWVATPTSLYRINPANGAIIATAKLMVFPEALAPSFSGASIYVLGDTRNSAHVVLADYSSLSGRLLGTRKISNYSTGPFAVVRGGVWISVQSTKTQSTTFRLFKGRNFTSALLKGKFTFDTEAYVGGGILWLVDAGGRGPTVCADPMDGATRGRGTPLGVGYGVMAFDKGDTYLIRSVGANESLLQVIPSKRCSD